MPSKQSFAYKLSAVFLSLSIGITSQVNGAFAIGGHDVDGSDIGDANRKIQERRERERQLKREREYQERKERRERADRELREHLSRKKNQLIDEGRRLAREKRKKEALERFQKDMEEYRRTGKLPGGLGLEMRIPPKGGVGTPAQLGAEAAKILLKKWLEAQEEKIQRRKERNEFIDNQKKRGRILNQPLNKSPRDHTPSDRGNDGLADREGPSDRGGDRGGVDRERPDPFDRPDRDEASYVLTPAEDKMLQQLINDFFSVEEASQEGKPPAKAPPSAPMQRCMPGVIQEEHCGPAID